MYPPTLEQLADHGAKAFWSAICFCSIVGALAGQSIARRLTRPAR